MVLSPAGPGTKNNRAGESQQQFTRPNLSMCTNCSVRLIRYTEKYFPVPMLKVRFSFIIQSHSFIGIDVGSDTGFLGLGF
jgi:hypothetical protein